MGFVHLEEVPDADRLFEGRPAPIIRGTAPLEIAMSPRLPMSPCSECEKAVKHATTERHNADQALREATERAKEWSKKSKDFNGPDVWSNTDRNTSLKNEKDIETAVAAWRKAQEALDKARTALESCRKKAGK